MSSTTKRVQDGQILVLFAISATVIFTMAALAYDVGLVLVEQRDQQNAADAASLAGARYLPGDTATARARAEQIALENGFQDGVNSASVVIDFGSWSPGGGFTSGTGTGAIDVQITATRPSIFAGIIGRSGWDVSSHAVAVNQSSNTGPFAMLSLHPTACPAFRVEGTGIVNSNGNIQVNSACTTGDAAFRVAGTGALSMTAPGIGCNVVGGATFGGGVTHNDCNPANVSAPEVPDPYSAWSTPPIPAMPQAPQRWNPTTNLPWSPATAPPAGCPGSATPATAVDPQICLFGGSYAGQTWRLFPGYYPGGINLGGSVPNPPTYLFEPGVYFMGDGGFRVANAAALSVDPCDMSDPLNPVCEDQDDGVGGGMLIVNSTHPSPTTDPGQIVMNGGNSEVKLWPILGTDFPAYADYDRFVIYQDRAVTLDIAINGGGTDTAVRGIIYAPTAHVLAQGNSGTLTLDQIIASTVAVRGNGGTINIAYDDDFIPQFQYAGLVE